MTHFSDYITGRKAGLLQGPRPRRLMAAMRYQQAWPGGGSVAEILRLGDGGHLAPARVGDEFGAALDGVGVGVGGGASIGAKSLEAFFVNVGLGSTMTPQDLLDGRLITEVGIAAVRPAEFIILRFCHELQDRDSAYIPPLGASPSTMTSFSI